MSIDTHMQLRTPLSAGEVRAVLLHDPALADLRLVDHGERDGLGSDRVSLVVTPWEEDDHHLIDGGFETGSVTVTLIPGRVGTPFIGHWPPCCAECRATCARRSRTAPALACCA